MCARNVYGKKLNPYIKLKNLPLNWFKENISPAQIKNLDKIFLNEIEDVKMGKDASMDISKMKKTIKWQ